MSSATEFDGKLCRSCGKAARLRCPTCIKQHLEDSYFCSQDCFKSSWSVHKLLHTTSTDAIKTIYSPWPNYHFSGALRPYPQTPRREVPTTIPRPDYALNPEGISYEEKNAKQAAQIKVLDEEEQAGLRVACALGREVDRVVHEACIERECYPSPLGYYKFPKSCCTSVNEVICHGIPDLRPLQDGDLCDVDVTVYHRGFHGDLNETFFVGDSVDAASKKLVQTTYECLVEAIKIVRPGVKFREIGQVIQKHANAHGFSVVRSYCGHGIHRLFHTAPNVPHYAIAIWHALSWLGIYDNKAIGVMKAGNAFTIEPMINAGSYHDDQWPDQWTAVTRDGHRSAQFEQTLLVTDTGCDVLTARSTGRPWFMDSL